MDLSDLSLLEIARDIGLLLSKRGLRLASAESCTGGWIAKCCTDVAGSSAWFERGFVTYSNKSKVEMLGVDPQLLLKQGAVCEAVVRAMTTGALLNSTANVSVAVSGIVGPGGGSDDKPVGSVWIAWKAEDIFESRLFHFDGDREPIRRQAVMKALLGIQNLLNPD